MYIGEVGESVEGSGGGGGGGGGGGEGLGGGVGGAVCGIKVRRICVGKERLKKLCDYKAKRKTRRGPGFD